MSTLYAIPLITILYLKHNENGHKFIFLLKKVNSSIINRPIF
ncbi:hypothetical protein SAMN05444412_110124 [Rhodonellum ikkaensis]|uniref:Uncharacterized protein n=1 Tax=Rhodonellum ikkaensis TaxID=336829 RepID=A0A1H3S5Y2_9BACT|nr:hypothetical protein SAMN05444412_110124 [Rhodonellum ikkaensis]